MRSTIALTHVPSKAMDRCALTFMDRTPIDLDMADRQHRGYCELLEQCGAVVRTLDCNRLMPDCVFVEDTAIVFDEIAVVASLAEPSRQREPDCIERELGQYREVARIRPPATIEGGDVLIMDRTVLVGVSNRTNAAGIEALSDIVRHYGYRVVPVPVHGCLHLKTACCALDATRLVVNPAWLNTQPLKGFGLTQVPADEPWGANFVVIGGRVCLPTRYARTADEIRRLGFETYGCELSEFAKAEGGATCLSVIFQA